MVVKKSDNLGIYAGCVNDYVFNFVPIKATCLDVGCTTGLLGKKLIEIKGCLVDGLDYAKAVVTAAKKNGYRQVQAIDLNADLELLLKLEGKYDCIIFADVLEHLVNPAAVLKVLGKRLKINGVVIISVPNIAFAKQRVEMLFGRFNYNPGGGIMDANHLRFFTAKSVVKLCRDAGFEVEAFSGYALVKNKFFFLRYLAKVWPELFAIQFLLKLKKA